MTSNYDLVFIVRKKLFFFLVLSCVLALSLNSCGSDSKSARDKSGKLKTPGAFDAATKNLEDFYKAPSPLPEDKPGTLIWSQEIKGAPEGINAWRVLYVTTGVDGKPVATSGSIYASRKKKKHEVLVWAHGTKGIADKCAPSRAEKPDESIFYFKDYLDKGYAIVSPDYEGLGTAGVHPFLVGSSEAKSILDSIRMANDFDPIGPKGKAVIVGHSQGGHAALFAGELHKSYAPDVKIAGITAIAPVGELQQTFTEASSQIGTFGFVVMGAVGFKAGYPEVDLSKVFTPTVIVKSDVVNKSCFPSVLLTYLTTGVGGFVADPRLVDPWPKLFKENSPGNNLIDVPLLFVHGDFDETVSPAVSKSIYDSECLLGAQAQRKTYETSSATHSGVFPLAKDDVLNFVSDRFEGKKFESSC